MKLPAPDEYLIAVQNPRLAFTDPDLRSARYELDHFGLPRVMAGGFAAVFHCHKGKSHWAVRCFYRDVHDFARRYEAIGQFLKTCSNPGFVEANLLNNGILVRGKKYPIIKMPWIDGAPLNLYLETNISKPQAISWLPDEFLNLVGRLRKLGIAHGDLQHGNIMVTDHSLKLIDYDGVYLPALKGVRNNQQGHPNYQLPSRANEYGPDIDRFSEIIIYTALRAIVESPKLWKKYSNGNNLLFRQSDFVDAESSDLMSDLERMSAFSSLIPKLRILCVLRTEDVPVLDDFVSGRWHPPRTPQVIHPQRSVRPIFEVIESSDTTGLLARVGMRVTVVGQVIDIHEDKTKLGQPFAFLTFGDWKRNCFHLVAWSGALGLFAAEGLRISSYKGKWISITGVLSSYKNTPQIEVEMPSQVEVLSGSQEASNRLRGISYPSTKIGDLTVANAHEVIKARVFDYVVAHRDEYPSESTIAKNLGVAAGTLKVLLDELVREGKIKRGPIKTGTPTEFFPTSGSKGSTVTPRIPPPWPVQSGPMGRVGSQAHPTTGPTGKLTKLEADILDKLWGKGTSPTSQQPVSSQAATEMIPDPKLCAIGLLLIGSALMIGLMRSYVFSLVLLVLGATATLRGLTHSPQLNSRWLTLLATRRKNLAFVTCPSCGRKVDYRGQGLTYCPDCGAKC